MSGRPAALGTILITGLARIVKDTMSSLTDQQKCHIHSMENVTLTPNERTALQVLNTLLVEQIALDQAAMLMGVSARHTRRILATYREKGASAAAHCHRGRKPATVTCEAVIVDVMHLARARYVGANHTHLSELLNEREGINIGWTTLRRILVNAGLSRPRRRRLQITSGICLRYMSGISCRNLNH